MKTLLPISSFRRFFALMAAPLLLGAVHAWAQDDLYEDEDVPPVILHRFDFEGVTKDNFEDEILTIGGKRWKFHNARIVSDPHLGIPQGKSAVQIRAGFKDGLPAYVELLDNIKGPGLTFQFTHSGIDRLINRNTCWYVEVSMDDGKTWATKPIYFDKQVEAALKSEIVPVKNEDQGYRVRFYFSDNGNSQGKDWSVLLDNIMTEANMRATEPWFVQAGNLYDGFCTAQDSLTFKPILSGSTWRFGPEMYGGKHKIKFTVGNHEPQYFETMPLDIVFTERNLTPGKHHVNIQFVDRNNQYVEHSLQNDFDIYVKESTPVKGIDALLKSKVGEFYELTPEEGHPMIVNWATPTRAQRWLWDGKKGILVDDPRFLDPVGDFQPTKMMHAQKVVGQLLEINHNLIFRLDVKAEIDTLEQKYLFTNQICSDLSILTQNPEVFYGAPLTLYNVRMIPVPDLGYDLRPNSAIVVEDEKGHRITMNNIFTDRFTLSRLPESPRMNIFGIVGNSMLDGSLSFFPIQANEYIPESVKGIAPDEEAVNLFLESGAVTLQTRQAVELRITDMAGAIVWQGVVDGTETIRLPQGMYLLIPLQAQLFSARKFAV